MDIWLDGVSRCPSPNWNHRPKGILIDLLVIHNISLPPGQFGGDWIEKFFTNRLPAHADPFFAQIATLQVSAHLLIRRDGRIIQFVPLNQRAWHAGKSQFQGRSNCNDFSIGIELEGTDQIPYTDQQYDALTRMTQMIQKQYPKIKTERIVGHQHIAPERKTDPGPAFDWSRYIKMLSQIENPSF